MEAWLIEAIDGATEEVLVAVQEHQFTTETLEKLLEAEHLAFCGFMLPKSIKAAYQHCFPEDSNGTSLSNWGEFESNNPSTFQSMYQFWAYKPL